MFLLEWPRARDGQSGYAIQNYRTTEFFGAYIVSRRGPVELYQPFKIDGLYRILAKSERTPMGALKFIGTFGFPAPKPRPGYPAAKFMEMVRTARRAIRLADTKRWDLLNELFVEPGPIQLPARMLVRVGDDHPAIFVEPPSLEVAIWMQFANDCATGAIAHMRPCRRCGTWIKYGSGTGRRSTVEYCSNGCRSAATYARRR
jgi:hypothetical protein